MKELTIVFTKSRKRFPVISWLIRLWTKKPYSHVAREVIRQEWGKGYYQASEGSINYEHETFFNKKHEVVKKYSLEITKEEEMRMKEQCWKDAGCPYGMKQNIGIALVDICKFFGFSIENPWRTGKNCSELIYTNVLHKYTKKEYDPNTIKPHHIEEILVEKLAES